MIFMRQCFADAYVFHALMFLSTPIICRRLSFVCANVFVYFAGAYIFVYFASTYNVIL